MNASVAELEREVGEARQRFADSLERLRSPAILNELKNEALRSKDDVVRKASNATRDAADRALQDLKARATANPAAALSIGAGVALHLVRHPPISSLLIGFGLWSLFRTPPTGAPDGVPAQFGAQVASAANSGAEAAKRWGAVAGRVIQDNAALAGQAIQKKAAIAGQTIQDKGAVAGKVIQDRAAVASQIIQDQTEALAGAATVAMEEGSERLSTIRREVRERSREAAQTASSAAQQSLAAASRLAADEASRDQILLGAAAAAVLAAVGIALSRQQSRPF